MYICVCVCVKRGTRIFCRGDCQDYQVCLSESRLIPVIGTTQVRKMNITPPSIKCECVALSFWRIKRLKVLQRWLSKLLQINNINGYSKFQTMIYLGTAYAYGQQTDSCNWSQLNSGKWILPHLRYNANAWSSLSAESGCFEGSRFV